MLKDNEEYTDHEVDMIMMERAIEKDNDKDKRNLESALMFVEKVRNITGTTGEPIKSTLETIRIWSEDVALLNELEPDEYTDLVRKHNENREREFPTRTIKKDVFLNWYFSNLSKSSMSHILDQYVKDLKDPDLEITAQTLFSRTKLVPAHLCSDYVERFDVSKEFVPNKKVWLEDD